MLQSWILEHNLESFLILLARIAGYDFGRWDYDAVVAGLNGTSDENGVWFDYEFQGNNRSVAFSAAQDRGASVLHFRIMVAEDAVELVQLAFAAASEFDMTPHNSIAPRNA